MLRLLEPQDAPALLDFFVRNAEHLRPWIPELPKDFYSLEYQRRRLDSYAELARRSEEFRFGAFDQERLICSINLTAIEFGAFLNGRLGYSVDVDYCGRGVATQNIGNVCEFAFTRLKLHRVEANVMPRNLASKRALEKCGFAKVGLSPRMVQIAGRWEDHEMYAKLHEGEFENLCSLNTSLA